MVKVTDEAGKKALCDRLTRVEGQLRGLQKLIQAEAESEKVAQQMTAARKALDKAFFALVATLNHLQFSAFIDGTAKGNDTRAKPQIWSNKDQWNAAVTRSQDDVAEVVAAGKSGNQDQIKAAVGAVGKSCKSCHDDFRKD